MVANPNDPQLIHHDSFMVANPKGRQLVDTHVKAHIGLKIKYKRRRKI